MILKDLGVESLAVYIRLVNPHFLNSISAFIKGWDKIHSYLLCLHLCHKEAQSKEIFKLLKEFKLHFLSSASKYEALLDQPLPLVVDKGFTAMRSFIKLTAKLMRKELL